MRAVVLLLGILLGFATPALADDVAAAQSIIREQEQAFGRDDAAAAYSHAAPEIRQLFPQADIFMQMVQQGYPPVYRQKSFNFGDVTRDTGRPEQEVTIVDLNGQVWTAIYSFERQPNGSWKISGCRLVRAPGADV